MDIQEEQNLTLNLQTISLTQSDLEKRIRFPINQDHISFKDPKTPLYLSNRTWHPLAVPQEAMAPLIDQTTEQNEIYLFGLGLGEQLNFLLTHRPNVKIIAWERDPWLIRLILMHRDYRREILEGRLCFRLGVDLLEDIKTNQSRCFVFHPLLSEIYSLEKRLLNGEMHGQTAAIGIGGLFVDDLAEILNARGYDLLPLDFLGWSTEELDYEISNCRPKFIAVINYINGLAEFCQRHDIDLLCWEIDPNIERSVQLTSPSTSRTHLFTYRRTNQLFYQNAGFSQVEYLPLASNTVKRTPANLTPEERTHYQAPLIYVGSSMFETAALYRRQFLELYKEWHPAGEAIVDSCEENIQQLLDLQLQDESYILPELFEGVFGDFRDELAQKGCVEIDPLKLLAQVAAAERRLLYVASLAPFGMDVWGDEGWRKTEAFGVRYRGYAGHHYELTKIYSTAGIHIDIGRIYQPDIVTMRVFDVLACGGFLIAEHNDDLAELFQIGKELESFSSLAELKEKAAYFIKHPEKAQKIAQHGLIAVRERHTIKQRVDHMLANANFL